MQTTVRVHCQILDDGSFFMCTLDNPIISRFHVPSPSHSLAQSNNIHLGLCFRNIIFKTLLCNYISYGNVAFMHDIHLRVERREEERREKLLKFDYCLENSN